MKADGALGRLGVAASEAGPAASDQRFPDGAHFRIEIPSVENLRVLEAVLDAARRREIVVNRVSQGSGAMLLAESELRETAAVAAEAGVEVALFVGPREGYGLGAHARSADGVGPRRPGARRARALVRDRGRRACGGGGDQKLPRRRPGPADAPARHAVRRRAACGLRLEDLGRDGALQSRGAHGARRAGGDDDQHPVRRRRPSWPSCARRRRCRSTSTSSRRTASAASSAGNELADLVAIGAPLYAKFGLRNSRPLYPAGEHLYDEAIAIARAKVARAAVALEWLARLGPELVQSAPGAEGLRVPRPVSVLRGAHPAVGAIPS